MSRAGKIVRAVSIGYGFQAVTAATGLVLTPFLLSRLGAEDYGRWLMIGQVLGMLGLLDLGVTAILPREVARASGEADGAAVGEVARRAAWLVWLQTPLVALAAAGVWAGVSAARSELAGPLAVILAGFAVQFPLRVPGAVLNGLQDLEFCGLAQSATWAVTTGVTVALVFAGGGLFALAAGWAAGQLTGCLACRVRLRVKFPAARVRGGWPSRAALAGHVGPSFWASVRQLAGLLLTGSDLIVLGWVLGPGAVVAYACTVRLINLVNNQPYALALSALPALGELASAGDRERLWRACRALGLGMVMLSGGLAVAVVALNPVFVPRWVGAENYAGGAVTVLAVVAMVARHALFGAGVVLSTLRYDARGAFAAVADGLVMVGATAAWVAAVGPAGVPLGSLTAAALVTAPVTLYALAREAGVSVGQLARWFAPWAVRFAGVMAGTAAACLTPLGATPAGGAVCLAAGLLAYAAVLLPLSGREPLRGYRDQFVAAALRRLRPAPAPARND